MLGGMMLLKWWAICLWALAAYFAYIGIAIAIYMVDSLLSGPWLGPEPELLIPIALLLFSGVLAWLGWRAWKAARPSQL